MEWGGVKLLTLQVSQYPQWENECVHENEQEQQSTLKKKFKNKSQPYRSKFDTQHFLFI